MISVIIPLYNKEKQILHTLRSVFAQTYQEFEIIIVNDGSTDCSIKEVEKVVDKRIHLIHQANAGVSAARNRGIEEAKYELIVFLDADDEWKPEYLATQYSLYKKYPTCSVYACNYECKDDKGRITPTIIKKLPFNSIDGILSNYFEVASCSHPPLWTSAIMTKKNAIQSIGGFPLGIKSGEDLLTWAQLSIHYQIAYSKRVQAIYIFDINEFNKCPRKPEQIDFVGNKLIELYKKNQNIKCIKKYIAHWFQMRTSLFLRFPSRKEMYQNAFLSLRFNIFNKKIPAMLLITLLPLHLRIKLFKYK